MRRLAWLWVLPTLGQAQIVAWEKPIAPGLSYRMEVDHASPRVVHALRWSLGAKEISARSEVAQMRLFSAPGAEAREGMTTLMERSGAIAAVNGDFFPASGDPLNAVVRDGQILSRPFPGRACFGWGSSASSVGLLDWSASVSISSIGDQPLSGLNEDVLPDRLVLFTESCAEARAPAKSISLMIRMETVGFAPTCTAKGQVVSVIRNNTNIKIPPGHAVLVKPGEDTTRFGVVMKGDTVAISMKTTGMDWSKVDNVIGGGPMLLKAGSVAIDTLTAGFNKAFADTRHPRTAIGRTPKGDIWLVAVDGRQPMSVGASLDELAKIMLARGCTEATNLDGGGSTTLAIFGQVMNRPSDGAERKVANGILFFGPKPQSSQTQAVIQGPATIEPGALGAYRLVGADGKGVPDREVLWTASGPGGWVDQSGTLRPLDAGGPVVLRAVARGMTISLTVQVKKK